MDPFPTVALSLLQRHTVILYAGIEKIDEGKLELEVSDYDPRALVRQSAYIFSQPLRRKGIQLLVEVRPEVPPTARGDASRLRQVISNYL